MAVALWVFVPFTAAGQRGPLTPLPDIHLCFTSKYIFQGESKKETFFCQVPKIQSKKNLDRNIQSIIPVFKMNV
jgi:hypothetical protein